MATTTIEKTCPACNGTGGEGGKKTVDLSDFVSGGGLCSVCKGKGKVFETIHIKENPTKPTYSSPSSTSHPTSSSSDDGEGCLALIYLAIMIFVLIIMGYVVVYALILAPIVMIVGMLMSGWHSKPKWMKLIWPLTFFIIPWILLDWGVGAMLNDLDQRGFSLGTFGPDTLVILRNVYLVLGTIAVAVIIWDVVVPFVRQRASSFSEKYVRHQVDNSSGKIKFINSSAFYGKSTKTSSTNLASIPKWDYSLYRLWWAHGTGGIYPLTHGETESSIRLDLWKEDQSKVLKEIQAFDDEWKPINLPGPNSYYFEEHKNRDSNGKEYKWLEVRSFIIEFRRPRKQRTEREKAMIGKWQETYDPNDSIWKKFRHIVLLQRSSLKKMEMEFFNDRTFTITNRQGEQADRNIFAERNGEIVIRYKYLEEPDAIVRIEDDRLFISYSSGSQTEWERIEN